MVRMLGLILALSLAFVPGWAVALAIDGSPANNNINAANSSITVSLTTTLKNDVIVVFVVTNGNSPGSGVNITVSSVSSANTTGWARRGQSLGGALHVTEEWIGKAANALSSETLTVSLAGGNSGYTTAVAFAISGANYATPSDPNGALPNVQTATGLVSITTSNPVDILVAGYNFASTATPTAGAGWTAAFGGNFMMAEYLIVSAIQSSTTATIGTGNGDESQGIGDAIQSTCLHGLAMAGVGC